MIGLIGAMAEEISLMKEHMEIRDEIHKARHKYIRGSLSGQEIVLLQTGIGKVSAAIGTQILIDHFSVDQVIMTGLAGALVPNLRRGDIVVANSLVQYDFDLTAFGRRHGELPDVGRTIEVDPRLVKYACYAFDDVFKTSSSAPLLVVGTVISGDRFVSNQAQIEWLQREFGAIATEMEGAAVGYTCHVNEVPFMIIRTISDSAGSSAVDEFEKYLVTASEHSFKIVSSILKLTTLSERANTLEGNLSEVESIGS
jgi:adenosylhomocysteine nucleosidase